MLFSSRHQFNVSIIQKIVLGFGLAALLLALIAFITYRSTTNFLTTAGLIAHTRQVLEVHETLLRHLTEAESGERGFLITDDPIYLLTYTSAWVLIMQDFERLKVLTADNPDQRARLDKLEPLIRRKLSVVKENITTMQLEGHEKASDLFSKGEDRKVMTDIRTIMTVFENEERRLLTQRSDLFVTIGRATTVIIVAGTLAGVCFLIAATWMIVRDVTARRKAEEALAEERNFLSILIEAIPDRIYVKNPEGRYVLDNAAHRNYLGVQSLREVEGKTAHDFFPDELASLYREDDQQVMQTGKAMISHEEPSVNLDASLVWHATTKVPFHDTDGKLLGLLCISTDITERKSAEEKLRRFTAQLERSNKELQQFASIASHDLQEPLRKIQAFGDRLKAKCGEALGDQGKDYLNRMENAAVRMRTLIHDLLTLSRLTSMARPFEEVDLAEIVSDVVSDLEMRIEQAAASVEVGFLPKIEADPLQMRQLFQNLLSNALKFQCTDKKPEIIVSAKILDVSGYDLPGAMPADKVCQIMVQDNGIGFDEKYAEQIFAPFQRLHGRNEYEGTGIGLSVCQKITDRHGGNIMAKSEPGYGATFIVTLPIKQNHLTP